MNNSYTNNSLSILLFNANGLKSHINELQTVLFDKRVSETHLTKYSHISIPGYYLLKSNHPDGTAHDGATILIKTNLKFHPITNFSQNHIQSCAISITLNNIPIVIAAVYSPPKHLITGINFTEYFGTFPNNFIAGGDFNANNQSWGFRVTNLRGKLFQNFTNIKKFQILAPPDRTYWPTSRKKRPDILNIFVSKIPSNLHCTVNNILDLNSDHSSVILNIDATPQTQSVSHFLFSQSTNHSIFHNIIAQKVNFSIKLKSEHDIDEAVNNLSIQLPSYPIP